MNLQASEEGYTMTTFRIAPGSLDSILDELETCEPPRLGSTGEEDRDQEHAALGPRSQGGTVAIAGTHISVRVAFGEVVIEPTAGREFGRIVVRL
jgi:hypothetical protein